MGKNYNTTGLRFSLNLKLIIWITLLGGFTANAQLTNFGLDITTTDETCSGNGTMTFTVSNQTPGSTMLFSVYLLPDLTTPIPGTPTPSLNISSLASGTYSVVATQTVGTLSNTVTQPVVIDNNEVPLTYTFQTIAHNCNEGGEVVITATSGTAVQYEIISGPETAALQTSNTFTGLLEGTYQFRVYDECGQGIVTTYTVVLDPSPVTVSPPIFGNSTFGDCDSVLVSNTISYPEGTAITYPITIVYTIYPPGGATPIVSTQLFATGTPTFLEFSNEFPVNSGDPYTYDILISNGCGLTYGTNGMVVNPVPSVSATKIPLPCGQYYISLGVSQYTAPYTVTFLDSPVDFNPVTSNPQHPGPFTADNIFYGGTGAPVPPGNYEIEVTDACGRSASTILNIVVEIPVPVAVGTNNGCFANMGKLTVTIPERDIVFAEIISAPSGYTEALPSDVSSFITNTGRLVVTNLPVGTYILNIIDECGQDYEVTVIIPDFVDKPFVANAMADCNIGIGAVRVNSGNGKLVQLSIIQAPAAFTGSLPMDVSAYIDASGIFFMDNLPVGDYVFEGTDICGSHKTVSVTIVGYQPGTSITYTFSPHCNSFDITMSDVDTSSNNPTYWLQMLVPGTTDQWMNPDTEAPYTVGTMPDATNSLALPNNQTTFNLQYYGIFRVVKAFQSVGQGTSAKLCFEVLSDTFEYEYEVTIGGVYNLSCLGTPGDVYVEASGIAPLTYSIIEMDGLPFVINNGTSNIFSGLAPGIYTFKVENACGQSGISTKNINLLPDLVIVNTPDDILICRDANEAAFQEFDLEALNPVILGTQSPASYTVTYHLSQSDADNALNALALPYTNISNPQTIYARVVHNSITLCDKTVSFNIEVALKPQLDVQDDKFICDNIGSVTISANPGYDGYFWPATGETTSSITVYNPGTYMVTVTKNHATGPCSSDAEIVVSASAEPGPITLVTEDWTDDQNTITAVVNDGGNYQYSLDDVSYQNSPVFTGLPTGVYTVYVRDLGGCGTREKEIALLNYPKFFTPNGDGSHETWRIKNSWFEPGMYVYIYDRFGKLITTFDARSVGWDGNYDGHALPSTDYWFVVKRQDGRILKGHFAMMR